MNRLITGMLARRAKGHGIAPATVARRPDAPDSRGRARGIHPTGWVSGNCQKDRHGTCSQLTCSCCCHKVNA